MKLIIEGKLPNLNDYTKACRGNKYVGAKMKKETEALIGSYIEIQLQDLSVEGKAYIEFEWYEPDQRRDLDNICFAKKFILDALVSHGVLKTDDWKGVGGFADRFHVDKQRPRVEVEIHEYEN